ncbi:hypothetical protein OUZ56_033739 [Daphnia magna]|uniref:Uncharacterized protein n=1 Tax=Daphnia magna TaxID=35525 RepID=A0ABR0BB60_9CRUS|nr:hypothetical protein OUZ56_033739 [Daphnia magna]
MGNGTLASARSILNGNIPSCYLKQYDVVMETKPKKKNNRQILQTHGNVSFVQEFLARVGKELEQFHFHTSRPDRQEGGGEGKNTVYDSFGHGR